MLCLRLQNHPKRNILKEIDSDFGFFVLNPSFELEKSLSYKFHDESLISLLLVVLWYSINSVTFSCPFSSFFSFVKFLLANTVLINLYQRTRVFNLSFHKKCFWQNFDVADGYQAFFSSAASPVQTCVEITSTVGRLTQKDPTKIWCQYYEISHPYFFVRTNEKLT